MGVVPQGTLMHRYGLALTDPCGPHITPVSLSSPENSKPAKPHNTMSKLIPIALVVAFAPTATATSPSVQVSNYTANAQLVLNAAQPAAGQTLDVRLQHSRDNGVSDAWVDAGIAFAQVTNTSGNGHQVIAISTDGLKAYVRVVSYIAGGATALPHAVELIGNLGR